MSIVALADVVTALRKGATATNAELGLIGMLIPLAEATVRNFVGYPIEQATHTLFLPAQASYGGGRESIDVVNNRISIEVSGGDHALLWPFLPLRSVTSLYEDLAAYGGQGPNDFAAATLRTLGTDYFLDQDITGHCMSGLIYKIAGTWPARPRTVKITAVAGYSAAELDGTAGTYFEHDPVEIRGAAIMAIVAAYQKYLAMAGQQASGPLASESISHSGHSVSYALQAIMNTVALEVPLPPAVQHMLMPFKRLMRR